METLDTPLEVWVDARRHGRIGSVVYLTSDGRHEARHFQIETKAGDGNCELAAICNALSALPDKTLIIRSDAQSVVETLVRGRLGKSKKAASLFQNAWEAAKNRSVTFAWVPREMNKAHKLLKEASGLIERLDAMISYTDKLGLAAVAEKLRQAQSMLNCEKEFREALWE